MQVFISYKREDEPFARRLCDSIRAWGYTPWLDVESIQPGDDWDSSIHAGLKASEIVVGVMTPESLASDNVLDEWGYALSTQKRLLLVWLRDIAEADIPPRYIRIQRVNVRQDEAAGLARLQEALASPLKILASDTADPIPENLPVATPSARPVDRNRERMLHKVRTFWVEGVLEKSLFAEIRLDLGMETQPDAVENPWDTVLRHTHYGDYKLPAGTKIKDLFDSMNGELLILGEPGSGKTTTLLELARDLIQRAFEADSEPIPGVFNLSSWANERLSLADWLIEELNSKYQVPTKVATDWVEEGQLILLLDGLDEVKSDQRNACVDSINAFRSEHIIDLVVCSRITDYEALASKLKLQGAVVLQALQPEAIDQYLEKLGEDLSGIRSALQLNPTLHELFKTPLMLSIAILAYQGRELRDLTVSGQDQLSEVTEELFGQYVQRMFERRGLSTRYTSEQTVHWLAWLAKKMLERKQTVFYVETLHPQWLDRWSERLILMVAVVGYFFYFTVAEYVAGIFVILAAAIFAVLPAYKIYEQGVAAICLMVAAPFLCMWFFYLLAALPASGLLGKRPSRWYRPRPFVKMVFSWDHFRSRPGTFVIANALLLIVTYIYGRVFIREGGFLDVFQVIVIFLLPLEIMLVVGMGYKIVDVDPAFSHPGEGIKRMSFKDRGVYSALRVSLWLLGKAPFDYIAFLNYCTERIFLRKVGGGYIFVHRLLLEYFAGLEAKKPVV